MPRLLLLLAFAAALHAGTIQGVVIEQASGRPLARATVRLDPVPDPTSTTGKPAQTQTASSGTFAFSAIPPGTYLLTAVHSGYFPAGYGQRLPAGRGRPITVTADSTLFAELRIHHQGALTGRVLDENGVGAQGVPVFAYRARLPLLAVGSGTSDDRGVYRIPGLEPGKYWVRSGTYLLEDGSGWLPTFGPQNNVPSEARVHPVALDSDAAFADVSPLPGRLHALNGQVRCPPGVTATVVLSSETGRRSTQVTCPAPGVAPFEFGSVAPGLYELFAATPDGALSAFTEFSFSGARLELRLSPSPTVNIEIRRAASNAPADIPIHVYARRLDLSEASSIVELTLPRATLPAGHWQFHAKVPSGMYVESIAAPYAPRARNSYSDPDWFEATISPYSSMSQIRIAVSDRAAQLNGRVLANGNPAPGSPVFLLPLADDARRALGGPLQTITTTAGNFYFDSLPPGDYRILATFDANDLDADLAETARAPVIHCEPSKTATVDLPLWSAP